MSELRFNIGDIVIMDCDYWYKDIDLEIILKHRNGYTTKVVNSEENKLSLKKTLSKKDIKTVLKEDFGIFVYDDLRLSKSIKLCYPDE